MWKADSTTENQCDTSHKLKKKNHMFVSVDTKLLTKFNSFIIKIPKKLGIEENFLNLIKNTYKNSQQIINSETLDNLPPRLGKRQECPFPSLLFNIVH